MNQGASERTETTTITTRRSSGWWIFFGLIGILAIIVAILVPVLVYTGTYSLGADSPDPQWLQTVFSTGSDAGVSAGARHVTVPAHLDASGMILIGAAQYHAKCQGCHLAPGMQPTDINQGLYPPAPALDDTGDVLDPAEAYWTIDHGIKSTGMPAWGKTNSPEIMWDIVSFLQWMPGKTAAQYDSIVQAAPKVE